MIKPINLSPSFLSVVIDKGYDYAVAQKLGQIDKLPTAPMNNGRLLHAMIAEALGGEPANYVVSPYPEFRTKEAKEWRDKQPDNTLIVKENMAEVYTDIVRRIIKHPALQSILNKKLETEKVYIKEAHGFTIKGILDLVATDDESVTVVDWKFVSSQVFDTFTKKALWQHYDLQSAVYDFLAQPTNVYFCAIESEAPYRIKLFHCDSTFLENGADKFDKAVKIIKEAKWREPTFDIEEVDELVDWMRMP